MAHFLPQVRYFIPIGEHHAACLGKKMVRSSDKIGLVLWNQKFLTYFVDLPMPVLRI